MSELTTEEGFYTAEEVAEYIIYYCTENLNLCSNLLLQKLLYFVQAYYLIHVGKPAFTDEIEAWDIGPVVPGVFAKYRQFGAGSIFGDFSHLKGKSIEDIDEVLDYFACYPSPDLQDIIYHQAPWKDAYAKSIIKPQIITKQSMLDYFSEGKEN